MFNPDTHASLSAEESSIVRKVVTYTKQYFLDPRFDSSHDFEHVQRVVGYALRILDLETTRKGERYDPFTVILGALLHDVGDRKYTDTSSLTNSGTEVDKIEDILTGFGVSGQLARKVERLVAGVSYSAEIKDLAHVQMLIETIPELAVVQDADRLDAIGAVGIGRCFTFGGAKGARSLEASIEHFEDKLVKLQAMMKTKSGRAMAAERTVRIREFMAWWREEAAESRAC